MNSDPCDPPSADAGAPMIALCGHMDVPAGRRDAVSAALAEHIRLTRAEPGCLRFEVTPDPEIAGRFRVDELFASRTDFEAHQARAAASHWGRVTQGIPRNYRIEEVAQ